MSEPRQIAVVRNYDEFRDALRARADELRISRENIDRVAGLADGHAAHLLAEIPVKNIGPISFGPLLQALGLVVVVLEDAELLAKFSRRAPPRAEHCVNASDVMLARRRTKKYGKSQQRSAWGSVMKARQMILLSGAKRSEIARTAAAARWHKPTIIEIPPKTRKKPSTLKKSKK